MLISLNINFEQTIFIYKQDGLFRPIYMRGVVADDE